MGALTVRLPKSLHERIRTLAEQEGISMNQFMLLAAAEKAAALDASHQHEYLRMRARRAEARARDEGTTPEDLLRALLDRVPDVPPDPEDRMPGS